MRVPAVAWWPCHVSAGASCDAPVGLIDQMPTFLALAGSPYAGERRIDGADISDVFFGRRTTSPHEAYYLFSGMNLEAVRSGSWKLAIAPQSEKRPGDQGSASTTKKEDYQPILYDLAADIGERTDVAAVHPEIVQRLLALTQTMDEDLGRTGAGKGVRPMDTVADPKPLLLAK